MALLSGPIDKRARLGTRRVPTTELRAVTSAAVDTFLQAFGPAGSSRSPAQAPGAHRA